VRSVFTVERYESAARFLEEAGPWLAAHELRNNLVLSLAHLLASGEHPFREPIYLAAVKHAGSIVGCAVRPPPDHLDLTALPRGATAFVAASAAEHCPDLSSIGGPPEPAREFAQAWVERRGGAWRELHRWQWLVLRAVMPPRPVPGALRLAEPAEWPLIDAWGQHFARENSGVGSVRAFLERRLRTQSLYVWDHGGPKCMTSVSGLTPRGARLSGVFTPPEHRGRGYASNTVAAVAQQTLATGREHCVLFAESTHTNTLRVYRRLGYEPMHETVVIELRE
jgi:GNAT superfamily N-acetyltransferase